MSAYHRVRASDLTEGQSYFGRREGVLTVKAVEVHTPAWVRVESRAESGEEVIERYPRSRIVTLAQ